jgi:NitT/TauT family transport system substrate-binding protein
MDIAYCSSTAMLTAYDSGVDVNILCPIQSGGVSIVAAADAPYNTFEELVEYAKENEMPIMGGYHSAISSPRIVLEYALREAGLTVTEDAADYSADVLLMDLKGISNLIPSLSSGQVELWAGPVPNPQNAEAQGIGKIIATLDQLPEGKWVDFPCCTMNIVNSVKEKYPEVVQAMVQVTSNTSDFAQSNREETAELMTEFIGLDTEVLMENDTTYQTAITEHFTNGMATYYDAMSEIGKFSGRLKDKTIDEVMESVFDFTFAEKVSK